MLTRKINAVIGLLATVSLLAHAISIAVWMLSKGSVPRSMEFMSRVLVVFVLIHVFISVDIIVSGIMSESGHKVKKYPKMNVSTVIQRVSGVLMVLFTGLHIAGAIGYMVPPRIVHGIVPPLFFLIALVHTSVSASKALITLGIGSARFIKAADVAVKAICLVTLICDVVGFYLYVW